MGKVILFASGKGGVGKTTLTAGIGFALADLGKKVLLIDADIRLRNLDLVLGAHDRTIYDIQDIYFGRCKEEMAVLASTSHPGLHFLSAPLVLTEDSGKMYSFIRDYAVKKTSSYDYVLVDCPAGIDPDMKNMFCRKVGLICVATPDIASVRDAEKVAYEASDEGVTYIRLVVNRVSKKAMRRNKSPDIDEVIDGTKIQLIGLVPEDRYAAYAVNIHKPLFDIKKSHARITFINIAKRIDGAEKSLYKKF